MRRAVQYPPADPTYVQQKWYQTEPIYNQSQQPYFPPNNQQQLIRPVQYQQPIPYNGYNNFPPPPPPQYVYSYGQETYFHDTEPHFTSNLPEQSQYIRGNTQPQRNQPLIHNPTPTPVQPTRPIQPQRAPEQPIKRPQPEKTGNIPNVKPQETNLDFQPMQYFDYTRYPVPQCYNIISRGNLPSFFYSSSKN